MQIIEKPIKELKEYEKNPRNNDEAVEYVANSIKEFGFKVPIILDEHDVIIAGHTRLKAAKKLHMKKVPCVVADDLSDEQVRAFRLADNKVAEIATWDFELLDEDISQILDIDMKDFAFEFDDEDECLTRADEHVFADERLRTNNEYNLANADIARTEGFYQMPIIKPIDYEPSELIGFNYALSAKDTDYDKCIHFFIDDYQFERVWNQPERYIDILSKFDAVLTPDFSLYMDMPRAIKIWNVYRSRLIGQMCQDYGLNVIPTVSWAEGETFEFCFDGLPKNGTLAISTIGIKKDELAIEIFRQGVNAMIKKLTPKKLLLYGGKVDCDFGKTKTIEYKANSIERLRGIE